MISLEEISEFEFKNLNPIYQGFFVMLFFAIIVSTCSYFTNDSKISKVAYIEVFRENFSGSIVKKYLDKHNHMCQTFKLNDSSEIYGYSIIWDKTDVGDSLVKKANSRFVKILKKDTTIVIDMNNAFRYHDTLLENEK